MKRSLPFLPVIFCSVVLSFQSWGRNADQPAPALAIAPAASNIAAIGKDTIVVTTGSTRRFTVDTPEDQGLVSTGIDAAFLPKQFVETNGVAIQYQVTDKNGTEKKTGEVISGDRLVIIANNGYRKSYYLLAKKMALSGQLRLAADSITAGISKPLTLFFTAGQRSPDVMIRFIIPAGISVTPENTSVNIIGRGAVKLKDLPQQSVGRVGAGYPYQKVGDVSITKSPAGKTVVSFQHLDLRPANGIDLKLVINDVRLDKTGNYLFSADYTTSEPERLTSPGIGSETAILSVTNTIADFERIMNNGLQYHETTTGYTTVKFRWSQAKNTPAVQLMQSTDHGKSWQLSAAVINPGVSETTVKGLLPAQLYAFRLAVKDGLHKGFSNTAYCYTGKIDIKDFGVSGLDNEDNTDKINEAIAYLHKIGGGVLLFSKGFYSVRTVHLQSNVWLYVEKGAVIKALKNGDAPESTWFSDRRYRSGLSPTDEGPYADPENYLTKQDVGHHYFRNAMFFGERLDNVKIIGNGLITGNGNLVNSDKVMSNAADNRSDKMFSLKLCTNVEIGGISRTEDLWYDTARDEPYYIGKNGAVLPDIDNMLQIDRGGHFALLATGTDNLNVHDTYFGKASQSNVRDIYDFMACNNVTVTNIYSKVSSDDIIKPGSDCSLGFTRPASNYKVRNVIGDTNCNLFQIGSETADDITDICIDNIYVLGANKAGFSISTNDGAHVKNIHLNCGHTGTVHSRSKMFRTTVPFFISISNRGRIIGAKTGKYSFTENGKKRDELLVKNVNIGEVENIIINGIDISEVYSGSSYGGKNRWKTYDGTQKRATSIIAGYSLPDNAVVNGGLNFKLPNGKHTGYIKQIVFNDVHILDKGGNPVTDTAQAPPELGVGQYNASNLKVQPAFGLWARHVNGLSIKNSSFNYEQRDGRYVFFLDDVKGAQLTDVKTVRASNNEQVIGTRNATGVLISNLVYFNDKWGQAPAVLSQGRR